jgi:hypothetical protein
MILGINTAKSAFYIAECVVESETFKVKRIVKVPFKLTKADDLGPLLQSVTTILSRPTDGEPPSISILKCVTGMRASSIEAIKAEAMIQLAASQKKLAITEVAPGKTLTKLFGCKDKTEKWQPKARLLLDPESELSYWTEGGAGAVAAAYKLATT